MTSRLQGIIFDKDGTLFDFRLTWADWTSGFIADLAGKDRKTMRQLAQALQFDLAERTFAKSSPMIAGTTGVLVDAARSVLPHISEDDLLQRVIDSSSAAPQVPATTLVPLMENLKRRGLALGVATNDGEAPARSHLQEAGIIEYFTYIAGYDSGFGAKPDPGMLTGFCQSTSIPAERCAMVGDSRHDLTSGRAAGMLTIGVLTGTAEAEELSDLADVILPNIGALPDWLEKRDPNV